MTAAKCIRQGQRQRGRAVVHGAPIALPSRAQQAADQPRPPSGQPHPPQSHHHQKPEKDRRAEGRAEAAERDGVSFSPLLQRWIERALQVDGETFQSLEEAQTALAELLQEDPRREPPRPGLAERSVATGSPPPVGPSAASQPEPVVNTQPFDRFTETIRPTAAPPRSPEQVFARGPEPPRKNDLNQPSSQARTLFDYEPTAGNRAISSFNRMISWVGLLTIVV